MVFWQQTKLSEKRIARLLDILTLLPCRYYAVISEPEAKNMSTMTTQAVRRMASIFSRE